MRGGSEAHIEGHQFRLALVRAIGKISGRDLSNYDVSEAEAYRVVRWVLNRPRLFS